MIKVLPQEIAELIAAGEVVERPLSVVKELVENSIDAGAKSITVEIRDGGTTYIRVRDDGAGIAKEDIKKAFLRHATSKISEYEDLEYLSTLGFRGEALAAISAVSRVELLTATDNDSGALYRIEGGVEVELDDAGCPKGTTFVIADLFYNTPARMKFLKKNSTEGNAIADILDKLALSNPDISFRFIKEGKEELYTPGDGKLSSAISAVLGKSFFDGLTPVSYDYESYSLTGYVTKPTAARGSRSMQYFFINERFVKNRIMGAALDRAFSKSITTGKFAGGVLFLKMPSPLVDVNVHPNKTEVRFHDDRDIFDVVYRGVANALIKDNAIPQLKLQNISVAPSEELPVTEQQSLFKNKSENKVLPSYFTANKTTPQTELLFNQNNSLTRFVEDVVREYDKKIIVDVQDPDIESIEADKFKKPVFAEVLEKSEAEVVEVCVNEPENKDFTKENDNTAIDKASGESDISSDKVSYEVMGEVFGGYVVVKCEDELLLIDKHAAHERFTYETIKENIGSVEMQTLLTPISISLSKNEYDCVINSLETLQSIGFEAEDFGIGTIAVRAIPMVLNCDDIEEAILDIAKQLTVGIKKPNIDIIDEIIHSVACRSSLMYGKESDILNLQAVVDFVLKYKEVRYCPHGRPVAYSITKKELDKQFMRI